MHLTDWLLSDLRLPEGVQEKAHHTHPWWRVMCLTGVDYFSTLGYQPGIAFLAAGVLSPVATLILVLVTLLGALPVYSRVAAASPNGQGSVGMLERLFPQWIGKTFILILLGFATTDFVITMTLSSADAAAHIRQNPFTPFWMRNQLALTLSLLAILGAIFLKGFKEAINVAVALVGSYLAMNLVITVTAMTAVARDPHLLVSWKQALTAQHGSPFAMLGIAALMFPRLALGLSGFETGVAVMPLIEGPDEPTRIRNTRRLLLTAAVIMSVFLLATSMVTTLLIPPAAFAEGGPANGRALSYLCHQELGSAFGSAYDLSSILILAFAGASAMAGLLNLIPRYLPRFGMAPEWALASRPLVLVFLAVAFTVTLLFHADVDAQAGAYATGVLVLMTSGACAVTIAAWHTSWRWAFFLIAGIFVYTTAVNIYERPEGIRISSVFILVMILTSLLSRALRSTELRIREIELDAAAADLLAQDEDQVMHIVARRPRYPETEAALDEADLEIRRVHNLDRSERIYFLQLERGDASEFEFSLRLRGSTVGRHAVLKGESPVVANSIASFLMYLEKTTGKCPHVYFRWTEGNPIGNLLRFLVLGEGDVAPLVHEVLRRAVPDPRHRPTVHVG